MEVTDAFLYPCSRLNQLRVRTPYRCTANRRFMSIFPSVFMLICSFPVPWPSVPLCCRSCQVALHTVSGCEPESWTRPRAVWDGRAFARVIGSSSLDWALVLVMQRVVGGIGIFGFLGDLVGQAGGGSLFAGVDRHGGGWSGSEMVLIEGFDQWGGYSLGYGRVCSVKTRGKKVLNRSCLIYIIYTCPCRQYPCRSDAVKCMPNGNDVAGHAALMVQVGFN